MIPGKINFKLIGVILIIGFSILVKFLSVSGNNFAFTYDQGRDMLDLRQIYPGLSPKLVGPTTSINGVLLGPFWYYLNLPAYLIGNGDPAYLVYWQIFIFSVSGIALFLFLYRRNPLLALIFCIFFFLMPISFETAKYFWNANAMPAFTVLFLLTLIGAVMKPSRSGLLLVGLVSGLSLQIEAAFGVFFLPFALLFLAFRKTKRSALALLIFGFALTLVPQVIFELLHGFPMSKVLIYEFSGSEGILGDKISFAARLSDRIANYRSAAQGAAFLPHVSAGPILAFLSLGTFFLIFKQKDKLIRTTTSASAGLLIITFVGYFFFPYPLKFWYLYGLAVPFTILLGSSVYLLFTGKSFIRLIGLLLLALIITNSVNARIDYVRNVLTTPSLDKSNFANQIKTVESVYARASGHGFKVYNYVASVYDFPYQYLFWWYGTKKFGYQPTDIAYGPNQPVYIKDQSKYWNKTKPFDKNGPIFLIIETDKERPWRQEEWFNQFRSFCPIYEKSLPWGTQVIELNLCQEIASAKR